MSQSWPVKPDCFPLLAAEKHYFQLDAAGHLQYYLYDGAQGRREKFSDDFFQQKINGFDAAVGLQGVVHLWGYEATAGLFYSTAPFTGQNPPLLLYRDRHKTIDHLSACRDQENNLHLLFLARSERYRMWWLFYLGGRQRAGGQHSWMKPAVIDFGYGPPEQYGLIGSDFRGRLFILYRLFDAGKYGLVFRWLTGDPPRPGKTIFLQEVKGKKEKEECFFPSFLIDPDDTMHLAWPGHQEKMMFLNYARRDPAGAWEDFFSLEIPADSFYLAPLFRHEDKLFLTWKRGQALFHLYSPSEKQGPKSWHRGKKVAVPEETQLLRLRFPDGPAESVPFQGFRGQSFFTAAGNPPQEMLQLENFVPRGLETANKRGGGEEENISPELPALHALDALTSYIFTHAGNLQTSNTFLKQKMDERGKEFSRLYTASLAQRENLEEKLIFKEDELEKIEKLWQQTMAELRKLLRQREEEIIKLEAEHRTLQKENEELQRNGVLQAENLARSKKELARLAEEIEAERIEKFKKPSFLGWLWRKICRRPPFGNA